MNLVLKIKDENISWEDIQALLNTAHKTNSKNGLHYSAENQSVQQLKNRVQGGITYVMIDTDADDFLVGTYTIKRHQITHWYVERMTSKDVILWQLVAVHTDYRGMNIASKMLESCILYAQTNNIGMIVMDTAEQNIAMKNLAFKYDFKKVDCCNWSTTNYISAVYVKWILDECPYSDEEINDQYNKKRQYIIDNNIVHG